MSPPIGIPQVYQNVCIKTVEWLFPNIPFAIKVKKKYYLQNLRLITGKKIVINFKILLVANTDQTFQI